MTGPVPLRLPGLPFPLAHEGEPGCGYRVREDGALELTGAPDADLFVEPGGDAPVPDAGRLVGLPPAGDFTLSARVRIPFADTYDAGVLVVHVDERRWAALCFEYTSEHRATAVTVVTRGESDDANGPEFAEDGPLWLRVTRKRRAWAFHCSTDGNRWRLLRYFALHGTGTGTGTDADAGAKVGFLVECPVSGGCTAVFDRISFRPAAPDDLRDGS